MAIVKNEIPILEFDIEQTAVVNPTHEKLDLKFYPTYITKYKGEEIVLCQAPVGVAPVAQILDVMIKL